MKPSLFFVFLIFVLSFSAQAQSPNLIITADCPEAQGGELFLNDIFSVELYFDNISINDFCGGSFSFEFYSTTNPGMQIIHRDIGGSGATENIQFINGWGGMFDVFNEVYSFGYDGNLPDSINFQPIGITCMVPELANERYIRFNFRAADTGMFCIDSLDHPDPGGDYDWIFPEYLTVSFSGPYCWNISHVCTDGDGDGYGDPGNPQNTCADDNCPNDHNPGQEDFDADGLGDICDECTDSDDDGYGNPGYPGNICALDNCPDDYNPDQSDYDLDGIGDVCDDCFDLDGDGYGDPGFVENICGEDNCPFFPNADQLDSDGNGVGDDCTCQGNTPIGAEIEVDLCQQGKATFSTVSVDGNTTLYLFTDHPDPINDFTAIPEIMPMYYNISTLASFTGDVSIEIYYDDTALDSLPENLLSLFLYDNGSWVDIGDSIDTENNTVYGTSASTGEFVLAFFPYSCGDFNNDWSVNILDVIYLIDYKFKSGPAPLYPESADVDCESGINILDIIYMIEYKFKDGPAPACCSAE